MGFIKAFTGALSGTFADQWLEYMKPDFESIGSTATVAVYPAVKVSGGQNTKGSDNIITNGTKIIVPDSTALITMCDGAITGCIVEPGGYTYTFDDPNAKSLFAGEGIGEGLKGLLQSTWDRTKHGNVVAAQHNAFYVNMKPIANNRFGTRGPIYWDDAFLQTQVAAALHGVYTLQIVDPMTFVKFIPQEYLMAGKVYDFADIDNNSNAEGLFGQVVDSLQTALSIYSNDPSHGNRITKIQSDKSGVAAALMQAIEQEHHWKENVGIEITDVSITNLDYDEATKELLEQAKADDVAVRRASRMGQAYANNMPGMMAAATGEAMQGAAANPNGAMMGFMGMNMASNMGASAMGAAAQQPVQPAQPAAQPVAGAVVGAAPAAEDPSAKLMEAKKLLDAGAISEEEYNELKKKYLGL